MLNSILWNLFFQEVLANLEQAKLLELAVKVFSDRKALLLEYLNEGSDETAHEMPSPAIIPIPIWCICGKCREMPGSKERKCCKRNRCISLENNFYDICLNGLILEVAVNSRSDIRVEVPRKDTKSLRHAAYRQFVMWRHGPLGAGNRVVIPSCCVWAIRQKYPSPNGNYTGYRDR